MIINFLVIVSFLVIFVLLLQNFKSIILIPFLYYLITLVPIYFATNGSYFWSFLPEHILLNNSIIIFAYFSAYILSPINNVLTAPFIAISGFKIKRSEGYLIFGILAFIFLEIMGVLIYNKPFFLTSLQNETLLGDRVSETSYPYLLILIFKNYYGLLLVFSNYLLLKLTQVTGNKRTLYLILFIAIFFIYLEKNKKSSVITFAGSCFVTLLLSNKFSLNRYFFIFFLLSVFLFNSILQGYYAYTSYTQSSPFDEIIERLLYGSIGATAFFHAYVLENGFTGIDYIPWEGANIYGFEGVSLEREIFYEQFTARSGRYGNTPVFSITYGLLILNYWAVLYLFIIYLLFFSLDLYFKRIKHSTRSIALAAALSVFFMPLFVSGAFKLFSLFILFPITLWALLIGSNLLPAKEKI